MCVRVKGLRALLPSTTTTTTLCMEKKSLAHRITGGGVYSVVRKAVTNVSEGLVYLYTGTQNAGA